MPRIADAIVTAVATELQVFADRAGLVIEMESRQRTRTIRPHSNDVALQRLQGSTARSVDAAAVTVKRRKAAAPRPARSRKRNTQSSKRLKKT
jgi:hypothetical protein